jgi:hypothetical protein
MFGYHKLLAVAALIATVAIAADSKSSFDASFAISLSLAF